MEEDGAAASAETCADMQNGGETSTVASCVCECGSLKEMMLRESVSHQRREQLLLQRIQALDDQLVDVNNRLSSLVGLLGESKSSQKKKEKKKYEKQVPGTRRDTARRGRHGQLRQFAYRTT